MSVYIHRFWLSHSKLWPMLSEGLWISVLLHIITFIYLYTPTLSLSDLWRSLLKQITQVLNPPTWEPWRSVFGLISPPTACEQQKTLWQDWNNSDGTGNPQGILGSAVKQPLVAITTQVLWRKGLFSFCHFCTGNKHHATGHYSDDI